MRETIREKVKPALEALAVGGSYLQFQVVEGYKLDREDWQSSDDPIVLSITISAITAELAALILKVSQEYYPED